MKRLCLMLFTLPTLLALLADSARAQYPYPTPPYNTQPRVSPYLNLLRSGSSPAVNYYDLVRPQVEFRQGIQQLQYQTTLNQQAITDLQTAPSGPVSTGHPVGFMNHLSYFQNFNAGTAGTSFGGTGTGTSGQRAGTQPRVGGTSGGIGSGVPGGIGGGSSTAPPPRGGR